MAKQQLQSENLAAKLAGLENRMVEFTTEAEQLQTRLETARRDVASGAATLSELASLQRQSDSVKAVLAEIREQIKNAEVDLAEARRVEKWQGCEVKVKDIVELKDKTLDEYHAGIAYLCEVLEGGIADLATKKAQFKDLGLQIRNTACAHYANDNVELNSFLTTYKDAVNIHIPVETATDNFSPAIRAWLPESGQDVRIFHY